MSFFQFWHQDARTRFQYQPPDRDPFAAPGRFHPTRGRDHVLFPDSRMTVGHYRGHHMRRIPGAYLAWCYVQPWSETSEAWRPVRLYVETFPDHVTPEMIDEARRQMAENPNTPPPDA